MSDRLCSLLVHSEANRQADLLSIKNDLASTEDHVIIETMNLIISLTVNGERMPQLLMPIIRHVLPRKNRTIKKLILIYLEIIDRATPDGKLFPEMILICNSLRNDLISPNEYVRGFTLRSLTRIHEPELLQELLEAIKGNLKYHHAFVRRNAVLCLYSIFKSHPQLIPDGPRLVFEFLEVESDLSAQRNAFAFLIDFSRDLALEWLSTKMSSVASFGDVLQLSVVDLVKKICRQNPEDRGLFIKVIFTLLQSATPAVQYEAAQTLVSLSAAPTALNAAAQCFIRLLMNSSDNNVKLILLDRLEDMSRKHQRVMEGVLLDIMRSLRTPSLDIRGKVLKMVASLVSPKTVDEVVSLLKKEIARTTEATSDVQDSANEYRLLIVWCLHECAARFPQVAPNVIGLLLNYLEDTSPSSSSSIISFVQQTLEMNPSLKESVLQELFVKINEVSSSDVLRHMLWILGEYSDTLELVGKAWAAIKESVGEFPFVREQVGEDGTQGSVGSDPHPVRMLLFRGDFFLACSIASTMTKLVLRARKSMKNAQKKNAFSAEAMLLLVGIARLGRSSIAPRQMGADVERRIVTCIKMIAFDPAPAFLEELWLSDCHESLKVFLEDTKSKEGSMEAANKPKGHDEVVAVDVAQPVVFRMLKPGGYTASVDIEEEIGFQANHASQDELSLSRVHQLTGFDDPIYAEAVVSVNMYDIRMDVLVMNKTQDTLHNLALELSTLGDLKLVERPQTHSVAGKQSKHFVANIKVSSTETGIIFGNIVYDISGAASSDKNIIILSEIHVDIMDYISAAVCTDAQFRSMWAEFEWENKVVISEKCDSLFTFVEDLASSVNMGLLTPISHDDGDCGYLSVNLYARSVFGEDALANVSVEKQYGSQSVSGFVRIRSKSQGIALSLGDKITLAHRRV